MGSNCSACFQVNNNNNNSNSDDINNSSLSPHDKIKGHEGNSNEITTSNNINLSPNNKSKLPPSNPLQVSAVSDTTNSNHLSTPSPRNVSPRFGSTRNGSIGSMSREYRPRTHPQDIHVKSNKNLYLNPDFLDDDIKDDNDKYNTSPLAPSMINITHDYSNRLTSPNNNKKHIKNGHGMHRNGKFERLDASQTMTPTMTMTPTNTADAKSHNPVVHHGSLSTPTQPNTTTRARTITNTEDGHPTLDQNAIPSDTNTPDTPDDDHNPTSMYEIENKSRGTIILEDGTKSKTPSISTPGDGDINQRYNNMKLSSKRDDKASNSQKPKQDHLTPRRQSFKQFVSKVGGVLIRANSDGHNKEQRSSLKTDNGPLYTRANSMGTESTRSSITRASTTGTRTVTHPSMEHLFKPYKDHSPRSGTQHSADGIDIVYATHSVGEQTRGDAANKARNTLIDGMDDTSEENKESLPSDSDDDDGTPGPPPKLEMWNHSNKGPGFIEYQKQKRRLSRSESDSKIHVSNISRNSTLNNNSNEYHIIGTHIAELGPRQETVGIEKQYSHMSSFRDSQFEIAIEYDTIHEDVPRLGTIPSGRHSAASSGISINNTYTGTDTITPIQRASTTGTGTGSLRDSKNTLQLPSIMAYVAIFCLCDIHFCHAHNHNIVVYGFVFTLKMER